MSQKKHVLGIDLGTTKSCISLFRNNNIEIIKVNGDRVTESVVCYDIYGGIPHVGISAKQSSIKFDRSKNLSGIKNCIYDVKRFIGRSYSHPRIQDIYKRYPFEVGESDDGQIEFRLQCANGPLSISPQQVSSEILKYLKKAANNYIGCDEDEEIEAVITVPAYFDISQRKATIEAANLAGIKVLKLLNEPTAAALHHLFSSGKTDTTLLVFDFGGGTFDVSIIEADISKNVTVVATAGDPFLGGRDIDDNIVQYMQSKLNQKLNERIVRRLRTDAETMKTHLTQYNSVPSEVLGEMDIYLEITKDIFNEINKDIFARCMIVVKECLKQANKEPRDIKEVLLVGGSSLIPKLESRIYDFFYNSAIVKSQDRTEIVCYGAALQASMIKGILNFDLKISDMLNISLGYEASGGEMICICKKQSKIPMTVDHEAVTMTKDQKKIVINIYEGERKYILYNTFLGALTLNNLPRGPAGCTFKIKFTINESGILKVAIKYDEDHAKSITLDLNTSKRHQRTNIIDIGTNYEDREFMKFNQIKTAVILNCNLYMNKSSTPMSDLQKIKLMLDEVQRCNFDETNVETLRAIIRHIMQRINFIPFIERIDSVLNKNY